MKYTRQDWAERLLPVVLERWGADDAIFLLSMCGEATVRTRLPQLGYAIDNWRTITTRNPDLVGAYLENALNQVSESDRSSVWYEMGTAVEAEYIETSGSPGICIVLWSKRTDSSRD